MTIRSSKRVSSAHLLASACALLSTALPAIGQSSYHLYDPGKLGGVSTFPTAINNLGMVLGQGSTGVTSPAVGPVFHAYLVQCGTLRDIAPLPGDLLTYPVALNDAGQALIASSGGPTGNTTSFVYNAGKTYTIAPLVKGASTNGLAINAQGQVTGQSFDSVGDDRAIYWDVQHGTLDIGTLNPDPAHAGQFLGSSIAYALNSSGMVVGRAYTSMLDAYSFPIAHAFRWTLSKGIKDLGTLRPDPQHSGKFLGASTATAINANGAIIGTADTSLPDGYGNFLSHGFVWTKTGGMVDLGTLAPDRSHSGKYLGNSTPVAINASGQIVGYSDTSVLNYYGYPVQHAFLWTPGGRDGVPGNPQMKDLGVAPGDIAKDFNSEATGINDAGDVIGESDGPQGYQQGFLYTHGALHVIQLGSGTGSQVYGINAMGTVIGSADTPDESTYHAFFFDCRGIHDLGSLGGDESVAIAINDFGLIAGQSYLSDYTTLDTFIVFPY